MTMRPQNQCTRCGYTWYPRGKNLSLKCPNCGSRSVQFVPFPVVAGLGIAAIFLAFLICGGVGALFSRKGPELAQPVAKSNEPREKPNKDGPPNPDTKSGTIPKRKPTTKATTKPSDEPLAQPEQLLTVPIAPAPRRVPLNRPPTTDVSKWVQRGGVRTRVVGASVRIPILTDDSHHEFPAKSAALLVWVEAQNLTATGVSLRRWIQPLNEYATLTDKNGVRIKPAKFGPGARVGGELEGGHSLIPGGPGIVDVLAFEVPASDAGALWLALSGVHVAERENFQHLIPYEVWSKK